MPGGSFALDGTPLSGPWGGIARYTVELTRALVTEFPESRYWILSDQPIRSESVPAPSGSPPVGWLARRWWMWGLPRELRRLGVQVFHGTDFSVPYWSRIPTVMTVHDLSPWRHEWQAQARRIRQRTGWLLKRRVPRFVITPSEAVGREVTARFGYPAERVRVTPLAASSLFRPMPGTPGSYFLFVGTQEPRKNVALLVNAWRSVYQETGVPLRIVGRNREDLPEFLPEPGLELSGPVADAELPGLYSGALAVAYPSLYEGFGLPVLEAMQCGAAVLTSRDPAITEVAGGAAWQIEASDQPAWTAALLECVRQPERVAVLRAAGLRRARQFSWQQTARLTQAVYDEAARYGRS